MTNTRITDPEILEARYPVSLQKFEIRTNSGGNGKWRGGDGVVRELLFHEKLEISLLSQHRKDGPYGMAGGEAGLPGQQVIIRHDGMRETLGGVAGTTVNAGDRIVIETPGGGGYGAQSK